MTEQPSEHEQADGKGDPSPHVAEAGDPGDAGDLASGEAAGSVHAERKDRFHISGSAPRTMTATGSPKPSRCGGRMSMTAMSACLPAPRVSFGRVVVYGGKAGEFDARGDVELGEGVPEMVADGVLGQEQPLGDLAVRQPSGDLLHDFELALGQP
jgi:hypothetical protein